MRPGRLAAGVGAGLALAAAVLLGLRLAPAAPLREAASYSTGVYAGDGTLLRLTLAADQQYRLWLPLEQIAPSYVQAALLYEDRWFHAHGGVNPAALARSGWATLTGDRRQGGSTITMQLARRLYGIDSRRIEGKLRQIGAALWLEARYSKRALLEAYLNLVPFGANVEGVGAASLAYFHKQAKDLTLPEALTLAVVPQNPRSRGLVAPAAAGVGAKRRALEEARSRLARLWLARHPDDARHTATSAPPIQPLAALPFRAPHLVDQLLKTSAGGREIQTALDPRQQATLERVIAHYVERHREIGVRNAAAVLVDSHTMEVRALVGSADFRDAAIEGQVNGVAAKRSPGSTLKPFIYALAIDQGVLHPMSVLKDAPTAFGPFSPENFDGRFVGPVSAQEALVRSRNVPAVAVAAKLARPTLYDLLKASGVDALAPERHYGLALTLGGGEVTMEELARLYALLPNAGELRPLRYERQAPAGGGGTRLLSAEASFMTLEMLRTNPRPDTMLPAQPPVAWKTGTSWGFRDAWTAGIFGRYVLVVWIGNFDGRGNPAFVGVHAAAPLFFQAIDALRAQGLEAPAPVRAALPNLARVEVCRATGDLPNVHCPERTSTWFIPGKSPIRVSDLHRRVLIDTRTGKAACEETATTRWEVHEYWAPDMQRLFREAGMPRREAPPAAECAAGSSDDSAPTIQSPLRGVTYALRMSEPTPLALSANSTPGAQYWFADNSFIGEVRPGTALAWQPPKAGRFQLRVVDAAGNADTREVSIEVLP